MTNIYDDLGAAGRGLRPGDLKGQVFVITALEEGESQYKDDQGKAKRQYKATIIYEDNEEVVWLGSGTLGQCDLLVAQNALPIRVTIIGEGKQGSPFKLGRPEDSGIEASTAEPVAPTSTRPWAAFNAEAKRLGLSGRDCRRYFGADDAEGGLATWAGQEAKRTKKTVQVVILWMLTELSTLAAQVATPVAFASDEFADDELPFE